MTVEAPSTFAPPTRWPERLRAHSQELVRHLEQPVDGASLALFRVGFGLFVAIAATRFFLHDWVAKYYETPKVFFSYWGLSYVKPLPYPGMSVVYALLGVFGLCLAWGRAHRLFGALTFVAFTYAHACDVTNYLNHYYFVSLMALLVAVAPVGATGIGLGPGNVRRLWLWLFRFQVACVYLGGGLAKLRADWLFHAQPLGIWLSSNSEIFLLGRLFALKNTAYAMSWAGAAYDLSIPFLLLGRRTRPFAYLAVVVFHLLTARLFQIGLFPWIMMFASLLFLAPSYPRRLPLLGRFFGDPDAGLSLPKHPRFPMLGGATLLVYVAIQIALPLRHLAYPGNLLWTEDGFRFSWHVMLMEKNGSLELSVRVPGTGLVHTVEPHDYLTPQQAKQMSTQPDLILAFAHVVRDDFARRGVPGVEVYASHSDVSLNGRAPVPLVDPHVDLAKVEDGLGPKTFLLPAPTSKPLL